MTSPTSRDGRSRRARGGMGGADGGGSDRAWSASAAIASAMNGGPRRRRAVGRWLAAWVGGAVLGIANGVAREANPLQAVRRAHRAPTLDAHRDRRFRRLLRAPAATLAAGEHARGAFGWRCLAGADGRLRVPVRPRRREAELVADYNLARGRAWPLVLAWIAIGPAAMARVAPSREPAARR
jgi:hypothetical protein